MFSVRASFHTEKAIIRFSSNVIKTVKQTCTAIIGAGLLIAFGFWLHEAFYDDLHKRTSPAAPEVRDGIAFSDTTNVSDLITSGLVSSEAGKAIYLGKGSCGTCHGISGRGDGPLASQMAPRPTDLTGYLKYEMDSDRFLTIKYGIHGTGMVDRPDVTDQEAWDLIGYLHQLQCCGS